MISLFFLVCIFSYDIYFSLISIFGSQYEGIENGNFSYWFYLLFLFLFSTCYYMIFKLKKSTITKKELVVTVSLLLFPFLFFSRNQLLLNNFNSSSIRELFLVNIFIVPAIIAGWYFSWQEENKKMEFLNKNLEILMIVFTLSLFLSVFQEGLTGGVFNSIGGATYQTASYISAFSFGINLYYIIFGKHIPRYKFTKKKMYKIFQYMFLIIQISSLFIGGGRGAFVLLIFYIIIYCAILGFKVKSNINIKHTLTITFIVIVLILFFNFFLSEIPIIAKGIERVFAYVSPDGIRWEGTSGRDLVYTNVLALIKKRPITGVGFFNYQLPHNIVLEIVVATGLLGSIPFILFFTFIFRKLLIFVKQDWANYILLVILLYPFTMLMFSGTFLKSSTFWFVVSYIFFINLKKNPHSFSVKYK